MSGNHPTFLQKLAITKKLEDVCSVVDGFAQYRQGWTDNTVAEFVTASNPDKKATVININHVAGVRKMTFGPLKTGRENVATHEARIAGIENFLKSNFDYKPII